MLQVVALTPFYSIPAAYAYLICYVHVPDVAGSVLAGQ